MPKIYKYFSNKVIDLVFKKDGFCCVRCSLPKDYNDPYELFLGMDLTVPTEHLASYSDIIDEIPQYPTTCFSKSPIVSPMWAHYAHNHSGFVLEFDVDSLNKHFEGNLISDVNYKNKPDEGLADLLAKVSVIKKPRYVVWLHGAVFKEAYFSKHMDWHYEQESRFVSLKNATKTVMGNEILHIPSDCVTSIIVGNNYPTEQVPITTELSNNYSLSWYELKIGKSYPRPYLKNISGDIFVFINDNIVEAEDVCGSCSEPLLGRTELCPWCSITDAHKQEAAQGNPFRMMDRYGTLEKYLEEVSKIGSKRTKEQNQQ